MSNWNKVTAAWPIVKANFSLSPGTRVAFRSATTQLWAAMFPLLFLALQASSSVNGSLSPSPSPEPSPEPLALAIAIAVARAEILPPPPESRAVAKSLANGLALAYGFAHTSAQNTTVAGAASGELPIGIA